MKFASQCEGATIKVDDKALTLSDLTWCYIFDIQWR